MTFRLRPKLLIPIVLGVAGLATAAVVMSRHKHSEPMRAVKEVREVARMAKMVNLEERDGKGRPAVFVAAREGWNDLLEKMLEHGADVAAANDDGYTALHAAVANGRGETIKLLVAHHADVNVRSKEGVTPLHVAALRGEARGIEQLLALGASTESRLAPEARVNCGETPLFWAVAAGSKNAVRCLVKHQADVNARDENGATPLHLAASYFSKGVIDELLAGGAELEARDKGGNTPLHKAAMDGPRYLFTQHRAEKALLQHQPDGPALSDDDMVHGEVKVMNALIEHHANLEARTQLGWTPLHFATYEKSREKVELLLAKGADINSRIDSTGYTALHWASVLPGHEEVAKVLLSRHADPGVTDKNGDTPLRLTARSANSKVAKLLLVAGARK